MPNAQAGERHARFARLTHPRIHAVDQLPSFLTLGSLRVDMLFCSHKDDELARRRVADLCVLF